MGAVFQTTDRSKSQPVQSEVSLILFMGLSPREMSVGLQPKAGNRTLLMY